MPFNQRIGDIHPKDDTWQEATKKQKIAFHKQAGIFAVEIKRGELARGIGSNGRKMKPRKYPRRDGANGPVLTPHREVSRTARLMASHHTAEFITLFWRAGISKAQKLSWATILGFHADGSGRLPKRDVRLSKSGINRLKARLVAWWEANHAGPIRQARAARIAAQEKAARKRQPLIARITAAARKALEKRYPSLKGYLGGDGREFK